ncbi:Uncharacterised protein [Mycobacteroides abscessus subsp. abscessus]|nr:Uncharacterised protein [Mycobacteroides abscessus subsp. abscessus]
MVAVGDERLRAVDHPFVTVADRLRRDPLEVGTGAGLGHRDRPDHRPRGQTGEVLLLLGLRPEGHEVAGDDAVGDAPSAGHPADASAGDLLGPDHLEPEVRDPGTPELLGDGQADDARLGGLDPHPTIDEVVLLPLLDVGDDLTVEESRDGRAEGFVVVVVQVPLH